MDVQFLQDNWMLVALAVVSSASAIGSPDFSDDLLKERLALMKLAIPIDDRIEAKPFNKKSFDPNDPLVYEITKNGIQMI